MTTTVDASKLVNRPVSIVYNQWTQFEDFPRFMGGVQEVRQLGDRNLHWVAEIAGVKRQWDATILEQVPDTKIAWAATEGATNAGAVYFEPAGPEQTFVRLHLEYDPEGLVEKAGDKLNLIERQAEADLERFKAFIESEEYASGAWRGAINPGAGVGTPGVEVATSAGDSGKAGVSGKVVAAGAAAAVGAAGAAVAKVVGDRLEQTKDRTTAQPARMSDAPHTHDSWIGRKVVDRVGEKVGTVTDIFYDDVTGQPEWLTVSTGWFGTNESFVPIAGTAMIGDDIRVDHTVEQIKAAPTRGAASHLDAAEEDQLYAHYGFDTGGTDYSTRFGGRTRADEGFSYYDPRAGRGTAGDDITAVHHGESSLDEPDAEATGRRLRRYAPPEDSDAAVLREIGRYDVEAAGDQATGSGAIPPER